LSTVVFGLGSEISSKDVHVIDTNSEWLGVSRLQLMENAGRSIAEEVAKRVPRGGRVTIYAGSGGNGGDGLTAARHLAYKGYIVEVFLLARPEQLRSEETRLMYNALTMMDTTVTIKITRSVHDIEPASADVVIDALLGVGVHGAPRSPYKEAIEAINSSKGLKIAIDVPSGLDPDTGETPGVYVRADVTVTFHKSKPGLRKRPDAVGELVVAGIGAPPEAEIYVGPGDVEARIPRRTWKSHKGMAGRVLVIGGSIDFVGAPIIAAMAAERMGVDLVYLAAPSNVIRAASMHYTIIPVELREHPWLHPDHVRVLEPFVARVDSIAIGMGMGLHDESWEAFKAILELARNYKKPVLVDADGLKHLARDLSLLGENVVVTPHEVEFEKLFGEKPGPIENIVSRSELAARKAKEHSTTVLLKGPIDIITDGRRVRLNKTGSPAMSVGGTGDALAGITAALLAKKLQPFDAACTASFINGVAGGLAYIDKGESMTALDVVEKIPEVLLDPLTAAKKATIYRNVKYRERIIEAPGWKPV